MPIHVLVVEDSPLFASQVRALLERDPEIRVIGTARNGREALELTRRHRPDVVTMDIQMPVMDGLEAISRIMASTPVPILVLTADPRGYSGSLSMDALRRGALEVMVKPAALPEERALAENLSTKVKQLSQVPVVRHIAARERQRPPQLRPRPATPPPAKPTPPPLRAVPRRRPFIAIAASTGGPAALAELLGALPGDFEAPIAIVQHIGPGFDQTLARWLDRCTPLRVRVAEDGDLARPGDVWIAPNDAHLTVSRAGRASLSAAEPVGGHRPSGTVLLRSVARSFGAAAMGVVLTGMGRDGAEGLQTVDAEGGRTWAQDANSCVVYGMPRAAVELGCVHHQAPILDIAAALTRAARMARES